VIAAGFQVAYQDPWTLSTMTVRIISGPFDIETIAVGKAVKSRRRLSRAYGAGRWRKLKGVAEIELPDGTTSMAEVHWFEAHGLGRCEFKIKRLY